MDCNYTACLTGRMCASRMISIVSRRDQRPYLMVGLLFVVVVVVVGLTLIARVEGQHSHAAKEDENESFNSRCARPPKPRRSCLADISSWSYVKSSGECEKFAWGGCGDESNTFLSRLECEKTCRDDAPSTSASYPKPAKHEDEFDTQPVACRARKRFGPCRGGYDRRYYYDIQAGECLPARCPLCALGQNAFEGPIQCMQTCEASKVCAMAPREERDCEVSARRSGTVYWSFDSDAGECVRWTYGGCGGNANRFRSRSKCERTCRSASTTPEPEPDPFPVEEE